MQGYVSDQLIHFTGRSLSDDDARYALLLRLIRGGMLLDPRYSGRRDSPIFYFDVVDRSGEVQREEFFPDPNFEVHPHGSVDANEFVAPEIVCFCDIPFSELEIHTRKYSQFGLSFSKEFLIRQGANPVWYIARDAATPMALLSDGRYADFFAGALGSSGRADFLERLKNRIFEIDERESRQLQSAFSNYKRGEDDPAAMRVWLTSHVELVLGLFAYVFGYVKTFNPALADDDPDNYYMEREWCVIGKVRFKTSDIRGVVLPEQYVSRLRDDLPNFSGEIVPLTRSG